MASTIPPEDLIARATAARRAGRNDEARALLETALGHRPDQPVALNMLGLILIQSGDPAGAAARFGRAAALDPKAPPLRLNLGQALQAMGDHQGALAAFDAALSLDAYLLPALIGKGQSLERLGRVPEAVTLYRMLLPSITDRSALPPAIRDALAHGERLVAEHAEVHAAALAGPLEKVRSAFPDADMRRAQGYADHVAGKRRIYQQQPTDSHFPFLPAIEFFDRELFPWFEALEAATDAIRADIISLWDSDDPDFQPYVAYDPTQPVNQWAELNHSPRWSAWFLWKEGKRLDSRLERCPATAAALDKVPLLDVPGKSPNVMFSILKPRTRIPPHTGSSNIRSTVHLPLVVPEGCGFRVGSETREWRPGTAWAFDDTIEHEAWNDSDKPRAILILDAWNPLLTEAERAAVRIVG